MNVSNAVSVKVAEEVSKSVAVTTAQESAISTVNNVLPTTINNVANTVLKSAKDNMSTSLISLYENIEKLDAGMSELSTGITKYNNDGIKEITNVVNNNVKDETARVKSLISLGENYKSISSNKIDDKSETKFVLVIDGQKQETTKKTVKKEEVKTTFWDRIKNLFK